jgi:hypothetical protein
MCMLMYIPVCSVYVSSSPCVPSVDPLFSDMSLSPSCMFDGFDFVLSYCSFFDNSEIKWIHVCTVCFVIMFFFLHMLSEFAVVFR